MLWVDSGYRTLAIGTPSGAVRLCPGPRADLRRTGWRRRAEIFDFNGYAARPVAAVLTRAHRCHASSTQDVAQVGARACRAAPDLGLAHQKVEVLGDRLDPRGIAEGKVVAAKVDHRKQRAKDGDRGREKLARVEQAQPQRRVKLVAQRDQVGQLLRGAGRRDRPS